MKNIPDSNPEDTEHSISDRLKREMIRPPRRFKGTDLWPYSEGAKALLLQVSAANDTVMYRALSLIFIMLKRTEATFKEDAAKHVCGLAWDDINRWRAEVMVEFRSTLSDEEKAEALSIYSEYIDLEKASAVIPVSKGPRSMLQKKTAATQTTRSGKASASRKKRA